jgi:alkylation response protein AidB-like acyl-CoA dehydrogenase
MKLSEAEYGSILDKNIEKALKVENRYSFINANLRNLLKKEDFDFLLEMEENVIKLSKNPLNDPKDAYKMFPALGEMSMVQRMNPQAGGIEGSVKKQMLLSMAMVQSMPELDSAAIASGILTGNALYHNPKRSDIQEKALTEIYNGSKVGGIGITEPGRGSDAVNMELQATMNADGGFSFNGSKVFTTNGAVADYFATYGVTDISNPGRTMMLGLFVRGDEGLSTKRLYVPAFEGIGIAEVKYNNVTVGADRVLAKPGVGLARLFGGLIPERLAIIGSGLAGIWGAIAYATIYGQIRQQFGKPIFKYQGISNVIAELYSRASAYTAFGIQIADFYEEKIAAKIHHGEKPDPMDEQMGNVLAAQGKLLVTKMAHECAYECVQTMGGRGAINEPGSNNGINRGENLSRISEVVGGHRNIQLKIIQMGLAGTSAMAVGPFVEKAKRTARKAGKKIGGMILDKAEKLLAGSAEFLGDETKAGLSQAINKIKEATESKNKIELAAYTRALPKLLKNASKEAHKAKKAANK